RSAERSLEHRSSGIVVGLDRRQSTRGNDTAGEHWHVARSAQRSREGSPKPKKKNLLHGAFDSVGSRVRRCGPSGRALGAARGALAAGQKSTSAAARSADG